MCSVYFWIVFFIFRLLPSGLWLNGSLIHLGCLLFKVPVCYVLIRWLVGAWGWFSLEVVGSWVCVPQLFGMCSPCLCCGWGRLREAASLPFLGGRSWSMPLRGAVCCFYSSFNCSAVVGALATSTVEVHLHRDGGRGRFEGLCRRCCTPFYLCTGEFVGSVAIYRSLISSMFISL